MLTRQQEYSAHLSSDKWARLREFVIVRSGNRCELCSNELEHVHHIRYPKRFKYDHPDNLLGVCSSCHEKLHGIMPKMNTIKCSDLFPMPYEGIDGDSYKIRVAGNSDDPLFNLSDLIGIAVQETTKARGGKISSFGNLDVALTPGKMLQEFISGADEDEKVMMQSGSVFEWYVTEPGMYRLFTQCGKSPAAKRFQRWLFHDALPKIRRGESPNNQGKNITDPLDVMIQGLIKLKEHRDILTQHENRFNKLEFDLAATKEEMWRIESKNEDIEKNIEDAFIVSPEAPCFTSRLFFVIFIGISHPTTDQCKDLGKECKKILESRGERKSPYPPIIETNYPVNQWPRDILFDAAKKLGYEINVKS